MSSETNYSIISEKARIGASVNIGPFVTIYGNVVIGDNCTIDGYCEIGLPTAAAEGRPLVIGEGSHIRSHSVFYQGSTFGPNLITGHRVTVRELVVAGRNLQIGTLSAFEGHSRVGDFVKIHSSAHVGQGTSIGSFVWIYPYVVLTNDPTPPSNVLIGPTIHDFAVIATSSVVLPGVEVGKGALVGALTVVTKDVKPHTVVVGIPGRERGPTKNIILRDGSGRPAYPWNMHFHRDYPSEIVKEWTGKK